MYILPYRLVVGLTLCGGWFYTTNKSNKCLRCSIWDSLCLFHTIIWQLWFLHNWTPSDGIPWFLLLECTILCPYGNGNISNCWPRSWEVLGHCRLRQWHIKALLWNPHSVDQTWKEKANQWKGGKQAVGVKCFCVRPGLMTRLLFLLSCYLLFLSSFLFPLPLLLCLFLLSKGFLMTNLSGSASLPISHCGIQLPAHPLMNSPDSKDRADGGEDRWKIQKHTTPPSFKFQDFQDTTGVEPDKLTFSLLTPF